MKRPQIAASLKFKILAGTLGLSCVFGCAVLGNIHGGLTRMLREELTRRGTTIARALLGPAETFLATNDSYGLHRLLHEARHDYDDVRYLYVTDALGTIRAHTFETGFPQGLEWANQGPPGAAPRQKIIRTEEGLIQDIAVPFSGGKRGGVHVGLKEYEVRARIARFVMIWGTLAGCTLLLGMAIAYWLTARLTRRVSAIIDVARQVGVGDYSVRVQDDISDEIGELARAFNIMIEKVHESQNLLLRSTKLAAIGELASSVAHEINNPLNTVAICIDSLLERSEDHALTTRPGFEAFPRHLRTASDEVFRCKRITGALLDFARHKSSIKAPTDINQLASEAVALVMPPARKAKASVSFSPSAPRLIADVDRDQIKQVLLNLLLNALDHLPNEGGIVLLTTLNGGESATISVEDNGSGISPENLQRLFEPFFTTKPPGSGTGLGLAICRRIVDEHSGKIEAHSRHGEGARFTVTLPLTASGAQRSEAR